MIVLRRCRLNTVKTVGVMGKGLALELKNKYPEMVEAYKDLCDKKALNGGELALFKGEDRWVLLFPTKKHGRSPSKIEYIEEGLKKFCAVWDKLNIDLIAFSKLGCGNGGLDWNVVKPLMEKYLKKLPINILLYVDNYESPRHK
ncbi:macro domain-containing protein [Butyrivibrio sp. FC2001]|uniref:macro domain-containing protein n=1 Tax=Butyrivibrio sp. FC2001 TaxID=1280671 RepID=UPI002100AE5A|nr:macro domain-containing protein [Butyrivibrio sp. FC2001]